MTPFLRQRNKNLFEKAEARLKRSHRGKLEAIFVTHREDAGADRSFFHITGIEEGNFLYSSAVLTPDGRVRLFVHLLEEEEAKATHLPYSIVVPGQDTVANYLKGKTVIGVNASSITLAEAGKLKDKRFSIVNISQELEDSRAEKTVEEIARIRSACEITAHTASKIPSLIRLGMTERELAAKIDYEMAVNGSSGPAFATIAAFGENSAIPHATPTEKKLSHGDLILCDFGATSGRFASDITRVFVAGRASNEQKAMYNAVLNVQEDALKQLKVGTNGKEIHCNADRAILDFFQTIKKPAGRMGHGLGHSVGLYTHDGKRIGMVDYTIPDNFITTIEPAAYLPGFGGIRIEDTVLVARGGIEILTAKAPKENLIEITLV